jgi:hypothetical protein
VTQVTRSLAWLFTVLTAIRRRGRYTAKHLTGHRIASVTCLNSVACHQGCTASAGITSVARYDCTRRLWWRYNETVGIAPRILNLGSRWSHRYPLNNRLGGVQTLSGRCGKRKMCCPCWELNPKLFDFPARSLVFKLTKLRH